LKRKSSERQKKCIHEKSRQISLPGRGKKKEAWETVKTRGLARKKTKGQNTKKEHRGITRTAASDHKNRVGKSCPGGPGQKRSREGENAVAGYQETSLEKSPAAGGGDRIIQKSAGMVCQHLWEDGGEV